jgi:hypothetical protein
MILAADQGDIAMPATVATLADVLAYRHEGVIRRYIKEQGASRAEAEEVFTEMLRWLYLCDRVTSEGGAVSMMPDLAKLDEMWHCFVLFTPDYAAFCEHFFGVFLHHVPEVDGNDDAEPEDEETVRARLEEQMGLVYDILGEETLTRWFDECRYANR